MFITSFFLFSYYFEVADLLPYGIFVFLVVLGLILINDRPKSRFIWFCSIVLFFSCLRYGIGYDYFTYKEFIEGFGDSFSLMTMEPIPKLLISFAQETHYQLFFIITSFLIYIPVFYVIYKKSYSPLLSLWIYVFIPIYFLESLSVIRNHVAFSFFFLSYYFYTEKNYIRTIVFFILAIGFHYSTLFALPIFLFNKLTFKKEYAILILIVSLFSSAIVSTLISSVSSDIYVLDKFIDYAERSRGGGNFIAIIINVFILFLFVIWNRLVDLDKSNAIYLTLVCIGAAIWNLFSFDYTLRLRLSTYYLLFSILLIPECGKVIEVEWYLFRQRIILICFAVFLSLFAVNIKSNLETHEQLSFLPYKLFFIEE